MASHSLAIHELKKTFEGKSPFAKESIHDFYKKKGEVLTDNLLAVRINRLKRLGVVSTVAKGLFEVNKKRLFHPDPSPLVKGLHAKLNTHFPLANFLVWESVWLNEFMTLQILNSWTIIEVESRAEEPVFEMIQAMTPNQTYLNPGEKEWEHYVSKSANPVIVKTLLVGSPKTWEEGLPVPKLEKILVDVCFDKLMSRIFTSERGNILDEAMKVYAINRTTLLNYAARRGKKEEMTEIILKRGGGLSVNARSIS